jgi:TPR repeat protein
MDAEVRQLMESASRGDTASQRDLAERFYYGRGVERSVAEAAAWIVLAALNGDDGARYLLCQLCLRGFPHPPIGLWGR